MTNRFTGLNIEPYNNILSVLDKPMTTRDICDVTGYTKEMCNYYLARLNNNKCVNRTRDEDSEYKNSKRNPYLYTRIVESIENSDMKGYERTKEVKEELPPYIRVIAERHPFSEKKKSPRVYVGCSFNQVGW